MEQYLTILYQVDLFQGIEPSELEALLPCLSAQAVHFDRGSPIFDAGQPIRRFGVVLSGQVQIYQDDYYGNRSILGIMSPGSLFGESFACANIKELPVSALAPVDCDVLFIECGRLMVPCGNACPFHNRLIQNMLTILANKNISLTRKIELTVKRTTRDKLLAYLSYEAQSAGKSSFEIPFNRQQLADYLSVDRSAMSAELSKLRDNGVLTYRKNKFQLL